MRDLKVEALGLLGQIHRTVTFADTREKFHNVLHAFHDMKFNSSLRKATKANNKAMKYAPGSEDYNKHDAIAQAHQAQADMHSTMSGYHQDKATNASEKGYETNEARRHKIHRTNFLHQQNKQNLNNKIPKAPSEPKLSKTAPVKPPTTLPDNKIVTPKKVPNTITPIEKAMTPKPIKNNVIKPLKTPISKPTKPIAPAKQAAKLNVKATPTIRGPMRPPPKPRVTAKPKQPKIKMA